MEDGEHTIFLSTKGKNEEEVPKELVNLLKFVGSPLPESEEANTDEFISKLQDTIQEVKRSREMGARYMTFQELLDDERSLGREEGIGIGRMTQLTEQVKKKFAKNKTIEQIAEELEEEVSTITEIVENIANDTEKRTISNF